MDTKSLLSTIEEYCRRTRTAESTFGRHAVNDGKLVSRLRQNSAVTTKTIQRVQDFIVRGGTRMQHAIAPSRPTTNQSAHSRPALEAEQNFRFFDNRQKYLMFVNTCSEKWVVASRIGQELANLRPRPPALRLFDAGIGDGTVLTRVMRSMHQRHPHTPFYVVGKEISLEDVRLALEKMPDRFHEHPSTALVITNLNYADAPWLAPSSVTAAASLTWHEVALTGNSSAEFEEQITELQPFLARNWRARASRKTGNPIYEKPTVLVLYRQDQRFLLDSILPRRGQPVADYDLVIASQPYRARASVAFKAGKVIAPLARALGSGGRLIGIHSIGGDPGLELVRKIWPDEEPFATNRHELLKATRDELGKAARNLHFHALPEERARFRYDMHTLPNEIAETGSSIGTSTLMAAWNAATYVAQIEDQRLKEAMTGSAYLEATAAVLQAHDGLWFNDESFVISRSRDPG